MIGIIDRVEVETAGSALIAPAGLDDTVLYLADAIGFNEEGGLLRVTGLQLEYAAADHDLSTVTLLEPLSAPIDENEPVVVCNADGTQVNSWYCYVIFDDGDDAEAVPVPIPDSAIPSFPPGTELQGLVVDVADDFGTLRTTPSREAQVYSLAPGSVQSENLAPGVIPGSPDIMVNGDMEDVVDGVPVGWSIQFDEVPGETVLGADTVTPIAGTTSLTATNLDSAGHWYEIRSEDIPLADIEADLLVASATVRLSHFDADTAVEWGMMFDGEYVSGPITPALVWPAEFAEDGTYTFTWRGSAPPDAEVVRLYMVNISNGAGTPLTVTVDKVHLWAVEMATPIIGEHISPDSTITVERYRTGQVGNPRAEVAGTSLILHPGGDEPGQQPVVSGARVEAGGLPSLYTLTVRSPRLVASDFSRVASLRLFSYEDESDPEFEVRGHLYFARSYLGDLEQTRVGFKGGPYVEFDKATNTVAVSGALDMPIGRLDATGTQSIANAAAVDVTYQTATEAQGITADVANNRLVVTKAGIYNIETLVVFNADATGYREVRILVNGQIASYCKYVPQASTPCPLTTLKRLNIGDVITAVCVQNSGGSLDVSSNRFLAATMLR